MFLNNNNNSNNNKASEGDTNGQHTVLIEQYNVSGCMLSIQHLTMRHFWRPFCKKCNMKLRRFDLFDDGGDIMNGMEPMTNCYAK